MVELVCGIFPGVAVVDVVAEKVVDVVELVFVTVNDLLDINKSHKK
jgi:hypothetical protein